MKKVKTKIKNMNNSINEFQVKNNNLNANTISNESKIPKNNTYTYNIFNILSASKKILRKNIPNN